MIRRVARLAFQREDGEAQVHAYARTLGDIFEDWLRQAVSRGFSTYSLTSRLQDAAERAFEAAYLRGKRQVLRDATVLSADLSEIRVQLHENQQYLENSLSQDIVTKAQLQQLANPMPSEREEVIQTLRRAFTARIRNLYGGALWKVTEAGYRAGVDELRARLQARAGAKLSNRAGNVGSSLRAEEDDDSYDATGATQDQSDQSDEDDVLAVALGITVAEFLALKLSLIRVGTLYNAQDDGDTCEACKDDADGGENGDGIYWDEPPPMPGDDCEGKGNCRCWLETVWQIGASIF